MRSTEANARGWLLLLHQIPAKPNYLRVKVWRRMQRIGAVTIKNSAWVLPLDDHAMEDFQWLIREIEADGGEALLCEARFLAGLTQDQAEALARTTSEANRGRLMPSSETSQLSESGVNSEKLPRCRTWVTRRDVYVDRIASAWLIHRRIDPEARFRFVAPEEYEPAEDEIRFDMYEAEYSHVGDACTFEVLASTFVPEDTTIATIAEIVHDIDLKESRFGRPEAAGVHALLDGIIALYAEDDARLERGFVLFDELFAAIRMRQDPRGAT